MAKIRLFLFIALLLPLCCCKDGAELSPKDASRITGFWYLEKPVQPNWLYYFSDGYSEHRIVVPGSPDYVLEYSYRTFADTIFLSNIHTNQVRVWIVKEISEDRAQILEQTLDSLWPQYTLKRL